MFSLLSKLLLNKTQTVIGCASGKFVKLKGLMNMQPTLLSYLKSVKPVSKGFFFSLGETVLDLLKNKRHYPSKGHHNPKRHNPSKGHHK